MLSRLQCTFCLNQNNVNDYIKACTRQSLNCMHGIMLCPGITLALATTLPAPHMKGNTQTVQVSPEIILNNNIGTIVRISIASLVEWFMQLTAT